MRRAPPTKALGAPRHIIFFVAVGQVAVTASARAELDYEVAGKVQLDLRVRLTSQRVGGWYDERSAEAGVSRNQNLLRLKGAINAGRFRAVAELDFIWLGLARDVSTFSDLTLPERVDPFRLRAQALYVEASDLFVEGLDVRVGQQKVSWGQGDQFNPTNTLNASDLEDPLLFGEQLANPMARIDYHFREVWSLSAVLVPVFKPAVLPATAVLGLAQLDRLPFVDPALRQRIHAEKELIAALGYPTVLEQARPVTPDTALDNMQGALRLATNLGGQDLALSYYAGRTDIPVPYLNLTRLVRGQRCRTGAPEECVQGVLLTEARLGYPRMHVLGFNAAGEIGLFQRLSSRIAPIGYRVELGLFFPQTWNITLRQDELDFGLYKQAAGEYDYGGNGQRPLVVPGRVFAKWVVGLDYTFNRYVYANAQWVHGLPDEFGAGDFLDPDHVARQGSAEGDTGALLLCALTELDGPRGERCAVELQRPRIGDYLVLTVDTKWFAERLLLRGVVVLDLTGIVEERWSASEGRRLRRNHSPFSAEGFSAVVHPEVSYSFGHGFELALGALLNIGRSHTKFGDPAVGGSLLWTRGRFSF